ncbi:hypothetical protein PsYK624_043210 [Phanerochaete sordida]|uniref:F-box domain-containing protein n=1 Tax=Phanerochaete sordida TaxID=48140 RepID=A0A9P3G4P7_9APHY|nr:hypothetical protein PsYK624_043210 [Phanerochaete sordida]
MTSSAQHDTSRFALVRRTSTLQSLKYALTGQEPVMKLNYDVLERVMHFMGPWDILQMMQTSRTLRRLGIPVLVRYVYIVGPAYSDHLTMCFDLYRAHLFRDLGRLSWITHLIVPFTMVDDRPEVNIYRYPWRYRFTPWLQQIINLQFLDLTMNGEELSDTLHDWILSQKHLMSLKFREIAPCPRRVYAVLARLGPQLDVLHLDQPHMYQSEVIDPLPLLQAAPYVGSLTGLLVEAHGLHAGPTVPHSGAPFAKVETLIWTSTAPVETAALARAFPALKRLSLEIPSLKWTSETLDADRPPANVLDARIANARSPYMWPALEKLTGDLLSLWVLALRCPVAAIDTEINGDRAARVGVKMGHVVALLNDTAAPRLALVVRHAHVMQFGALFAFPTLRHLDVKVGVYVRADFIDLLEKAVNELVISNLLTLSIGVKPMRTFYPRILYPFPGRGHRLAARLLAKMPDVEELTINLWPKFKEYKWKRPEPKPKTK